MEQNSCGTETPPMSPMTDDFLGEMLVEDIPKDENPASHPMNLFCCLGEVQPNSHIDAHSNGPLRSGGVEKLISGSTDSIISSPVIELFTFHYSTPTALQDQMDQLFYLARQELFNIEDWNANSPCVIEKSGRHKLQQFMDYVKLYIQRHICEKDALSTIKGILKHVKGLLLCMDRLSQLSSSVLSHSASIKSNQSSHPQYHLFHCHLELHWAIVECLHLLTLHHQVHLSSIVEHSHLCETDSEEVKDIFYQCVHLLLWDIVLLAMNKYNKLSTKDHGCVSLFSCSCVKELMIMLLHLLHHRQHTMARESLWVMLMPIVQQILSQHSQPADNQEPMECDSDVFSSPPSYTCTDPAGFCWWLISQIVPLFSYDIHGYFQRNKPSTNSSNYYLLQEMLKKSLQMTEASLRLHLRCLVNIYEQWEPKTEVILKLWDHFSKKMNDQYMLPGLSLTGFACISKTAASLLEKAKKIASGDKQNFEMDCSYHLFLRVLAIHLKRSEQQATEWKHIKARVYMKLHGRRLHELTETGLQNLTMLFLVLSQVADLNDVSHKLCDVYSMLPVSQLDIARRGAVWKGTFALMMLYCEKGMDMAFLADKLAAAFNAVAKDITTGDMCGYADLWQLVHLYLESSLEVIDRSPTLTLQEHRLTAAGFSSLLPACRENELRHILTFVQTILTKHRIIYKRALQQREGASHHAVLAQHSDLSDALWKNFYPFCKDHSSTNTPPSQLADVAAAFALLVIDMPPTVKTGMQVKFSQMCNHFAWGDTVNSGISVRFLSHILANRACMEKLSAELPDYQTQLIKAWFRTCWQVPKSFPQLEDLSRQMLKLEEVESLLGPAGLGPGDDNGASTFLAALDCIYNNTMNLKDKISLRERCKQYFGDISKFLPNLLKTCSSQDHMLQIYEIGGLMAKFCSPMLYIKSRPDCLLPTLIERLALPRTLINPNKPLPGHVTAAIKTHLHLYVQGLSRLDYRRDPYVQRKLKDIITHYMTRFPVWSGSSAVSQVHPLLTCLNESWGRTVSDEAGKFRCYFLSVIVQEFIALKGSATPPNADLGWKFILELHKKTSNAAVIAQDLVALLRVCLDYQLLCESLAHYASQTMQCMVERYKLQPHALPCPEVSSIISSFLTSQLPVYQTKVLTVLESMAVLNPAPFIPIIPTATQTVKMCEAKRGVGIDKQLRLAYYSFLSQLGERGMQERSTLLRDSK